MTGQAPVTTLDTERGGGEDRGDQATGHWSCAAERTEGEAVMASLTRDSLIAIARELELI